VELTVLGTSAAWPGPGRASAGFLLRHDGVHVALDLGIGTLANLQLEIPQERLDAIVVTHEHLDHCLDLYALTVARVFHAEPLEPLPLYSLPGVFERVSALETAEQLEEMRALFDIRTLEAGDSFEIGPLRVATRALPHLVPNLGFRVETDGLALAYTGDTGPSDEVEALARDTDVFVSEASWEREEDALVEGHLSAGQAAEHATRAGAGRLVLTHFWPTVDRERARDRAAAAFDGEVLVAEEGMRIGVGG
jgi:ribonuclease BN (tRNA processing enzyme)